MTTTRQAKGQAKVSIIKGSSPVRYRGFYWQDDRRREVTGTDKADVERRVESARATIVTGGVVADRTVRVSTVLERWIAAGCPSERKGAPSLDARKWYAGVVRSFYTGPDARDFGRMAVADLTGEKLTAHLRAMMPGKSDGYILRVRRLLELAVYHCVARTDLAIPTDRLLQVRSAALDSGTAPKPTRALTDAQLTMVLDAFRGHRYELAVKVLAYAGLRRGELCGLRFDDVDLGAGTLTVNGQNVAGVGMKAPKGEGKGRSTSRRTVPFAAMQPDLLTAMKAHVLASPFSGQDFLFGRRGPDGECLPLNPQTFGQVLASVAEAAGVNGVNSDLLRHGVSTRLYDQGLDPRMESALLGHTMAIATKHYVAPPSMAAMSAALRNAAG